MVQRQEISRVGQRALTRLGPARDWALQVQPTGPRPTWQRRGASIFGLLLLAFAASWVISRGGTFTPWRPQLVELHTMLDASGPLLSGKRMYDPGTPFRLTPFAALAASPLSLLPWPLLEIVWGLLNVAVVAFALRRIPVLGWRVGLAGVIVLNTEPVRTAFSLGTPLLILVGLIGIDLISPTGRSRWGGVATGLAVAVSPYLAPFLLVLAAARRRRAALVGLGVAAACSLVALLVSPGATARWFRIAVPERLIPDPAVVLNLNNQSIAGSLMRWGTPALLAVGVAWLTALLLLAAGLLLARRGYAWTAVGVVGLAVTSVNWLVWPHEYIWLAPLAVALLLPGLPAIARILGAALVVWAGMRPWRVIQEGHEAEDPPLSALEKWTANGSALLLIAFAVLMLTLELVRLRAERRSSERPPVDASAAGDPTEAFATRWIGWWVPLLAAMWLAGSFFRPESSFIPWRPLMPDFDVYTVAARTLLQGGDIYNIQGWPFLYPPFAAILALPTGLSLDMRTVGMFVMQVLNVCAFTAVVWRIGVRGWRAPVLVAAALCLIGTLDADIKMGNVHGLMVALIFLDLAPGPGVLRRILPVKRFPRLDRERLIPMGVLIGLMTAIKIIPGLFIIYLLLTRRYRAALVAIGTGAAVTLGTALILPSQTIQFFRLLLGGKIGGYAAGPLVHYQGFVSAMQRFVGYADSTRILLTLLGIVIGLIGLFAAVRWHRVGQEWLALTLCGAATILISPLAWNYYYLWLLPGALIAARQWWFSDLGQRVELPDTNATARLPATIGFLLLALALWQAFQFHLALPSDNNIEFTYNFWHKLAAGFMPFATSVLLLVAMFNNRHWRARRAEVVSEP
ncbi:glycosyltransferase family 87 protein [Enemella evansiae]|uniref:glycosyltransferase family 87 protein n=1 Tax=Enemella evansiae TaxID=2016499 RepID=UPI000B975AA6|nr:glycosyltransferase family 87 protein [Enemella evansiae]OYO03390.1 hypothetical protein CGZ97_07970 [Enemella evansiae]